MKINNRQFFTPRVLSGALAFLSRVFTPVLLIAVLSFSAPASFRASTQQRPQQPSKCPTVRVSCPDSVTLGDKLTFTADVSGGDPNVTPTYNWTVSAGSISSGQGTSTIEMDLTEVRPDSTVTATVDVGGFARECYTAASCTTSIMKKAEARNIDEFGKLKASDEDARLANLKISLNNEGTGAQSYLIAYGGRTSKPGDAKKWADQAKNNLIKKYAVDPSQLVAVDGGYKEEPTLELWIVPVGGTPPEPTPTVDPQEVKPQKAKAKSAKSKPSKKKKS